LSQDSIYKTPRFDRLQSNIQIKMLSLIAMESVSRNFMYSKVTFKSIRLIEMIIDLKAVCRKISDIETSVSFAEKG